MKKFNIIFITLNLLISIFYVDLWSNANTTSRVLPIITYFESGSFRIDKYHELTCDKSLIDNHYYSDKAPLPTAIALPVFGLLKKMKLIKKHNGSLYGTHIYAIGTIVCSIVPFVLIVFITFKKIYRTSTFSPVLLSLLPFYGSYIFIFSGTFFNHLSSAFFLLLAYIYLKEKKYLIAGIFSGLSFLCEYLVAIVILIWACQILFNERNIKSAFKYVTGVMPALLMIMIYNYIFTNSPFTMLYKFHYQPDLHTNYGFNHPTLTSLWGLTFSDYRGMFFYAPFIIIAGFYFFKNFGTLPIKSVARILASNYLFLACIVVFIFISSYFGWHGGWTFGPRLLTFIAVLLIYEGIIFLSKIPISKPLFWIVTTFGIVCTFMDKATLLYSLPTEVQHPLSTIIIPQFLSGNLNANNLLTLLFNVHPFISFLFWCLLFTCSMLLLTNYLKKTNTAISQ